MAEARHSPITRLALAVVLVLLGIWTTAAQAQSGPDGKLSVAIVAGGMTTNGIQVVYRPTTARYGDNNFVGLMLGYEIPTRHSRWNVGAEVQLNQHFGDHEYLEFVLPATLRYSPQKPWLPAFDSFAFGVGLSYTSDTPKLEIATRGDSQRALVYLSLEAAFSVGAGEDDLFFRLHHRSDGYGLFNTDTGSNAFAVGFRKGF